MDFIKKIIPYHKTMLPKWFWLGTLILGLIGFGLSSIIQKIYQKFKKVDTV